MAYAPQGLRLDASARCTRGPREEGAGGDGRACGGAWTRQRSGVGSAVGGWQQRLLEKMVGNMDTREHVSLPSPLLDADALLSPSTC